MAETRGAMCPECYAFALLEPGGLRCVAGGHHFTLQSILPKLTTGHDRANRLRARALDEAFVHPGRGAFIPLELCIRLEGDRPD